MDATKMGFRGSKFGSTWQAHKAGVHPPGCWYCGNGEPFLKKLKRSAASPRSHGGAVLAAMMAMFPNSMRWRK
jgi:hypothetical protein